MTQHPHSVTQEIGLTLEYVRDLLPSDMMNLRGSSVDINQQVIPSLKKMRSIHHRQAALLAKGLSVSIVAMKIGCTTARLNQLMKDPGFIDLMEYYREQTITTDVEDADRIQGKLRDLGEQAVDALIDRLGEHNEGKKRMADKELISAAEFAMDRTVAPPRTSAPPPVDNDTITIRFGNARAQPRQVDATSPPTATDPKIIDLTPDKKQD